MKRIGTQGTSGLKALPHGVSATGRVRPWERLQPRRLQRFRHLFTIIALLFLAGCESVYAPRPMGGEPVGLDDSWNGTWRVDDGALTTVVRDAQQGLLQVAWVEVGAEGAELEVLEGAVRSGAGRLFFSIKDRETEHGYQWLLLDRAPHRVRAWYPDPEAFVAAVEQGRIPGKAFEGSVILGELADEHLLLIAEPSSGLLDWSEPLVLLRVGGH